MGNLNPDFRGQYPVDQRFAGTGAVIPGTTSHPGDPNARWANAVPIGNLTPDPQLPNGGQQGGQQGDRFDNARRDDGGQNFGGGGGGVNYGNRGGGIGANSLFSALVGKMAGPATGPGWAPATNAANLMADATYSQPGGVGAQLLRSNADIDIARLNNEARMNIANQQADTVQSLLPSLFHSLSNLGGGQRPQGPGTYQPTAPPPPVLTTMAQRGQQRGLLEQLMAARGGP